ncbi:MAG TPA: helix-turn-helix transcriptional regulator [Clostridiales bacterium]|nr:helix-turn-helix transcriptional regulator [Clostridiales bacterium]
MLYRLMGVLHNIRCTDQRLELALIHIHKHYMEKLRIEQLAKISCMSKYYFIRRFQEDAGMTPHEYINEFRIKMAQELLVRDDATISSVAHAVGFEDRSYFAELFKKLTGYLPREYRKLYRKDTKKTAANE